MRQEIDTGAERERVRGTMLGIAVGDALGVPLEGRPWNPTAPLMREMGDKTGFFPAGGWTDDTQQSILLARSLVERGKFDGDDFAARLVTWARSGAATMGQHTRTAVTLLARGMSWKEAGKTVQRHNPQAASNGSLMRSAPAALYCYPDQEVVSRAAWGQSLVTHAGFLCIGSCVFFNRTLSHLVQGMHKWDAVAEAATHVRDVYSKALDAAIVRAWEPANTTLPTGYVLDTLTVAVWSLLHTESFEDAVVAAVNRGADADTVGAVTGALAGGCYGVAAIPERWLAVINGPDPADRRKNVPNAHLLELADGLFAMAQKRRARLLRRQAEAAAQNALAV